jgi:two-component system LytT family sensor kinase
MEKGSIVARPVSWKSVAAIWTGVALFDATQTVVSMRAEGMHHAWTELFLTQALSWLPLALATPLIFRLGSKYPPVQLRQWRMWSVHVTAWLSICLVNTAWIALLEWLLNPWLSPAGSTFLGLWSRKFYAGLLSFSILYAMVAAIGQMLESRERLAAQQTEAARLSERLSKEQLNALRRQVEPHFLFNTLNGIAGLIRENENDAAVNMLAGLSDFLRHLLKDSKQQVPLEEELQFLLKYLDIEKMRFGDRMKVSLDVPEELLSAQVPSLILQPMVENSIKHGIARRAAGGEIRVSVARSNGMLNLGVYNDGPSLPIDWESSARGIGIVNVRTRLQGLYGEHFAFRIENRAPSGVEVTLSVPYQKG